MSIQILHIQKKNRTSANTLAKLEDFDYVEGETIDPKIIIENPNISLYCLDPQNQRAIFVETPLDIDIYQPPFLYQAQYDHAQRLFAVSFQELAQLAKNINQIENLVLIYSVGRCGSTLLRNIFNQLDTVISLSEPDVFSQLVAMREPNGSNDEQIIGLLKICLAIQCKNNIIEKNSCYVIKFRSFCIQLADLIAQIVPDAKVIFLYRNAKDVIKSSIRSFVIVKKMLPEIKANIELYSRIFPLLKDYENYIDFDDTNATDLYITGWLSTMQRYLFLHKQEIITCAVRYEDLVTKPQEIVTSIFEKCGLPVSAVENACKVFKKDSQMGSSLSQENTRKNDTQQPDDLEISQKITRLLNHHSEIKTPDFIVPGTLQ
ncbi:sulfotransferase [Crocosphaera sp. XPORK-15E]|uniref:sulfotransferase family protein n=1 Tax=Crocosphaera sp. XPORK-15E TaxID=3110247 RepID=UPI002B212886|nr:sulfotransferase [Crocosphaera sp. XPORK-15E]MEA5534920.1 sulfotransferase [Crocosphaera sp. XPORK-15E]